MNEPEISSQLNETACIEKAFTLRIPPEQLRRWVSDRRNQLQNAKWHLQKQAKDLEKEIAICDAMLAELITG